jgi:hypothetical protein
MDRGRKASFKIVESVVREHVITYRREELPEGTTRPYITGRDVLDHFRNVLQLDYDEIDRRIDVVQMYGPNRDIHIKCHEEKYCKDFLQVLPIMTPSGIKYVGEKASPDIYEHRPKSIRIYLREVPLTMKNDDIKRALRQYASFPEDTPIQDDTYRDGYARIKNGSRFINVREIFSKAGVPVKIYVKGRLIYTYHFGQTRNPLQQREIIWRERQLEWQARESKRREEAKACENKRRDDPQRNTLESPIVSQGEMEWDHGSIPNQHPPMASNTARERILVTMNRFENLPDESDNIEDKPENEILPSDKNREHSEYNDEQSNRSTSDDSDLDDVFIKDNKNGKLKKKTTPASCNKSRILPRTSYMLAVGATTQDETAPALTPAPSNNCEHETRIMDDQSNIEHTVQEIDPVTNNTDRKKAKTTNLTAEMTKKSLNSILNEDASIENETYSNPRDDTMVEKHPSGVSTIPMLVCDKDLTDIEECFNKHGLQLDLSHQSPDSVPESLDMNDQSPDREPTIDMDPNKKKRKSKQYQRQRSLSDIMGHIEKSDKAATMMNFRDRVTYWRKHENNKLYPLESPEKPKSTPKLGKRKGKSETNYAREAKISHQKKTREQTDEHLT